MAKPPRTLPPIHPGEILREELMTPLGLSINRVARNLRVPVTRISDIVNRRRGLTADTCLRLTRYFGNSPEFWMNLQSTYDLRVTARTSATRIARDVHPIEAALPHKKISTLTRLPRHMFHDDRGPAINLGELVDPADVRVVERHRRMTAIGCRSTWSGSVLDQGAATGLSQRKPGNRVKSASEVCTTASCSIATAAICASVTRLAAVPSASSRLRTCPV